MHLHAEMGDFVADIGGKCFADRRQEGGAGGPGCFVRRFRHVDGKRSVQSDGTG